MESWRWWSVKLSQRCVVSSSIIRTDSSPDDCVADQFAVSNRPPAAIVPAYIRTAFADYATTLDARHDRQERITKADRDVRIESKRIIFLLHRIAAKRDEQTRNGPLLTS